MTSSWKEQFKPVSNLGWDIRSGQEKLGDAIIRTVGTGGVLVGQAECGTGKSLASSIPLINAIHEVRKSKSSNFDPDDPYADRFRAVISTETITLQQQLDEKDLPFLKQTYGGFTFHKLLGRSNYLCLNRAKDESIGSPEVNRLYHKLTKYQGNITTGEFKDIGNVLKEQMDKETWSKITGSSDYCGANKCEGDLCYAALSRAKAQQADIVVVNHKILAIHFEMMSMGHGGAESVGMFGQVNTIIVDEAHKLEEVLAGHWEERYNEWEVADHTNRLLAGLDISFAYAKTPDHRSGAKEIVDSLMEFLSTSRRFFSAINKRYNKEWKGSENAFCEQYLTDLDPYLRSLMMEFETVGPALFEAMIANMDVYTEHLAKSIPVMIDNQVPKKYIAEIRKAQTSARYLKDMATLLHKAMTSRDGVVSHGDIVYGVIGEGWVKKDGEHGMTIKACPIDVSFRTSKIWSSVKSVVFLSATLVDLTENNFRYFKKSLGITQCAEISVESPFASAEQQLVYITPQPYPVEEGTFFSVEEVVDLVNASQGRSLLLFTSRREIEMAHHALLQYKIAGRFNYTMYVQEPDADKAKLVEDFKSDINSVMLGLKSMFTGIDIPGESLSNVIMCRWPMPRFSTECKMKIKYWGMKGFPNWYSRESLTTFQQAAGRLIRTESCVGVISIVDQRVFDSGNNIFKTASIGVSSLGSRVTHDISEISTHLGSDAYAV